MEKSTTGPVDDANPEMLQPITIAMNVQRNLNGWQKEIRETYRLGKNANHLLSRLIFEAKADLPYGEWTQLWQGQDRLFAVRKADKLAFVGERLTSLLPVDRAEVCLPTALNTLYILAQLPPAVWQGLIDAGRIHRKLKRKAAEALLEEFNPQPKLPPKPLKVRPVIAKILRHLRLIQSNATLADAEFAMKRVQAIIVRRLPKKGLITSSAQVVALSNLKNAA